MLLQVDKDSRKTIKIPDAIHIHPDNEINIVPTPWHGVLGIETENIIKLDMTVIFTIGCILLSAVILELHN